MWTTEKKKVKEQSFRDSIKMFNILVTRVSKGEEKRVPCWKKKKLKKQWLKTSQIWQKTKTYISRSLLLLSRFSRVRLCATPQKAAHQAPLSLGFSRQEHWSGLPFPSPNLKQEKFTSRYITVKLLKSKDNGNNLESPLWKMIHLYRKTI